MWTSNLPRERIAAILEIVLVLLMMAVIVNIWK